MKFLVEVIWESKAGNACFTKKIVASDTAGEAYRMAAKKVKKYVRFKKLLGGNARRTPAGRKNGSNGKHKVG